MPTSIKRTLAVACFCLATWLPHEVRGQAVRDSAAGLELRDLTRRSGAIFAGRVVAIQFLRPRFTGEVPTVRITFRVEKGIRGARTGNQFVLREWAALWNSGPRYAVGERILLFLYPASRVGLSSPVRGDSGRFRVDSKGQVVVDAERAKLFDDAHKGISKRSSGLPERIPMRDVSRMIRLYQAERD